MLITRLSLVNFRNYARLELNLPDSIILLQGNNAQGKTNLLEAIYYLATTKSPHASSDTELVNWLARDDAQAYARVAAEVRRADTTRRVELTLTRRNGGKDAAPRFGKRVRVNRVARRAMDLLGEINVVLFSPQDIDLVNGAPGLRRRYLDITLCQIDRHYCRALQTYNKVVSQRNHLLRELRERGGDTSQLRFWNEKMVDTGTKITVRRRDVLHSLTKDANQFNRALTGGGEELRLNYFPGINLQQDVSGQLSLNIADDALARHSEQDIREIFLKQLHLRRKKELVRGITLVGPHRDDFSFSNGEIDIGVYGSRGQQRTGALALRLAEVELMYAETGERPILLLDDVMSELDQSRRAYLLSALDNIQQAIITTTDWKHCPLELQQRALLWQVKDGVIEEFVERET